MNGEAEDESIAESIPFVQILMKEKGVVLMSKRVASLLLALILAATMVPVFSQGEGYGWTMYVYTDNGKTLNVRSSPSTGNNVIGRLNFGAAVSVRMTMASGWTCIDYAAGDGGVAYVQSRFLVDYQPGYRPQPQPVVTPVPSSDGTAAEIAAMNAEFRSAQKVSPFIVVARPTRASGWVNLRWAPSMQTEVISTCRQGKELTVLTAMNNWYQVEDPSTGMIGFISRQYVYRK